MLQKFCHFIQEKKLFVPENRILLAISGGMDSVVMADLFFNAGYTFAIAHCNFQLRGKESEEDEGFVKSLSDRYKVPFFVKKFDTNSYISHKGISIQMAARELRYSWFEELLISEQFNYFATAHHRNDVMETILLNLTKGTDLHGMTGIREVASLAVRPLLFATREEIKEFANENKLAWREDSSNESTKYQRNFIRHEVIPRLEKINPSLLKTFEETLEKLKASERIFNEHVRRSTQSIAEEKNDVIYFHKNKLNASGEPLIILFEMLREYGFNYQDVSNLINTIQTGKRIQSQNYEVVNDRDYFILTRRQEASDSEFIIEETTHQLKISNFSLDFNTIEKSNFKINISPDVAQLDWEKLKFPLKIRTWREGDYFIPFGMKGKKKLSDFITDQKIPLNLKQSIKVLVSGESIAWVIGYRIDERFRITEDTQKILLARKQNL